MIVVWPCKFKKEKAALRWQTLKVKPRVHESWYYGLHGWYVTTKRDQITYPRHRIEIYASIVKICRTKECVICQGYPKWSNIWDFNTWSEIWLEVSNILKLGQGSSQCKFWQINTDISIREYILREHENQWPLKIQF